MASRTLRRLTAAFFVTLSTGAAAAMPLLPAAERTSTASPASATVAAPAQGVPFGDAENFGSMAGLALAQPVVGIAATRSGGGYWLVARDGGIFSFGDADFFGSTGNLRLNQPIVGITASRTGAGYWFVAEDGGVFSFGDAGFFGSTGEVRLNQPIVGMAATPSGSGYWLVARDGGIFSFGDADFRGSTGNIRLNQPIVGMSATPTGNGYWLVAGDGGVFSFGDAASFGSAAGRSGSPVVGMAPSAEGKGYWLSTDDGAVFAFGGAESFGPASVPAPVVGIASTPTGQGFWLATADGAVASTAGTVTGSGSFAFLRIDSGGDVVRYDPCRAVHYVVNPDGAPAGAVDEVSEAFRRLGQVTGITFTDDGTTDEPHVPFGDRSTYQPDRYGDRWAPILVSWTGPDVEQLLAGATLGYGGSTSYWSGSSDEAFVTGEVVLDIDLSVLDPGFGPGLTRGNLLLHELGHVVGLDHVEDRAQLMYSAVHASSPDGYSAGDSTGLARIGAAMGCLDVASPR